MTRIYDVIKKKRDGGTLSEGEIRRIVADYTNDIIPDYQMSALLMAICICGMSSEETYYLTDAMVRSGDIIDLSCFGTRSADKHSTGGVGDKTTMIVAPLAAELGCRVAKMSGRGLGHTGGTIDKLESIPGYRTMMTSAQFLDQVTEIGVCVMGANASIAPADKKIYALRDVTGTVESIPLIASSIMSKKIAAGSDTIVLDVTVGSGAFMKDLPSARLLARTMVDIGKAFGKRVSAVLTDMDQPLGRQIGNASEMQEAIDFLRGRDDGLSDLRQVSLTLAAQMAANVHRISADEAFARAEHAWRSGAAYERFLTWMHAQGGDISVFTDPNKQLHAPHTRDIIADEDGYLQKVDAEKIGGAAMLLGAGRQTKDDAIDLLAGICMHKKVGMSVKRGDVLATMQTSDPTRFAAAEVYYRQALTVGEAAPTSCSHIFDIIT